MLRRRVSTAGAFLPFLAAGACAVGVDLGPGIAQSRDGGTDLGLRGAQGGADERSDAASSTGGAANGDASVEGRVDASVGGQSDARAAGDIGFDSLIAVDSATGCIATQKSCGGRCVVPDTRVGCAFVGCDPCLAPANGIALCTGTECDFSCLSGYVRVGEGCVVGDGGAGAADASNDRGPTVCVASQCGGCIPFIQAPCCKPDDTCGCQYPFAPCN